MCGRRIKNLLNKGLLKYLVLMSRGMVCGRRIKNLLNKCLQKYLVLMLRGMVCGRRIKNLLNKGLRKYLLEPHPFVWNVERWWWEQHRCSHLCVHRDPATRQKGEAFPPAKDTRLTVVL